MRSQYRSRAGAFADFICRQKIIGQELSPVDAMLTTDEEVLTTTTCCSQNWRYEQQLMQHFNIGLHFISKAFGKTFLYKSSNWTFMIEFIKRYSLLSNDTKRTSSIRCDSSWPVIWMATELDVRKGSWLFVQRSNCSGHANQYIPLRKNHSFHILLKIGRRDKGRMSFSVGFLAL